MSDGSQVVGRVPRMICSWRKRGQEVERRGGERTAEEKKSRKELKE